MAKASKYSFFPPIHGELFQSLLFFIVVAAVVFTLIAIIICLTEGKSALITTMSILKV